MNKLNYYDQLKHPLWQKKRLEIFQRDAWECRECGEMNKQLSIHHMYYQKGKNLWEYPDQSLLSLCEVCHEERAKTERNLLEFFQSVGSWEINDIMSALAAFSYSHSPGTTRDLCLLLNPTPDKHPEYQI